MKIFNVFNFAIITMLQLAKSHDEICGEAQVVEVSNETRETSTIRFPWAGAVYRVVNKAAAGDNIKYICGATIITELFSVTGKQSPLLL